MVVRLHLIIKKDAIANANKGVSWINYDQWGNPIRVQFTDHSITEHVYTADGRRLKTIHRTSVPQSPSLGIGVTASLPSSLTQSIDSVDYVGNFIYEKGQLKRYMFDDGYLRLNTNNTCVPRFFIKDHGFEMHNPLNPLNWPRNIETIIGKSVAGNGKPFEINIYGSKKLTPILPWIK